VKIICSARRIIIGILYTNPPLEKVEPNFCSLFLKEIFVLCGGLKKPPFGSTFGKGGFLKEIF
jgi:hypothetical protein